jgi:hypothetical protein
MAKRKAAPRTKKTATKARKAAPKQAVRKAAPRKATTRRQAPRKARKAAKSPAKPAARRAGTKKKTAPASVRAAAKPKRAAKAAARKPARKPAPLPAVRPAVRPLLKKAAEKPAVERKAPALNRARRVVLDDDVVVSPPSTLDMDRSASAARSGGRALHDRIEKHHETSPALTAGDVDADWEQAYSSGDEAAGGDNMTPDQDVVDEIGAALGVEYEDDEELQGGAEISERDEHRWDEEDS